MTVPTSKKRATIFFSDPEIGQSCVTENPDLIDVALRTAIKAAQKTFWKHYLPVKPTTYSTE